MSSLTLHYHPLASYCHKVLIALYELEVPFKKQIVDLGNEAERAALMKLWPVGKFPVLQDESRGITVPEATIIIEYLGGRLIPSDANRARECRIRDRFYDSYVSGPMQKIVGDKLRPEDKRDHYGVEQAKAELEKAYEIVDEWMREGPWAAGEDFTMADCSAAPALFYAQKLVPFGDARRRLTAYYARLEGRPSFARVLEEAKPYFSLFPG